MKNNERCSCTYPNYNAFTERCMICGGYYCKDLITNTNKIPPMTNKQLPAEVQEMIKSDAIKYIDQEHGYEGEAQYEGYIDGATAWAIKLQQAEEEHKRLTKTLLEIEGQKRDELKAQSGAIWVKGAPKVQEPHYAKVPSKIFDDLVYNAIIIPKGINKRWWAVGDGFSIDVDSDDIIAHLDESGATDLRAKYDELQAENWKLKNEVAYLKTEALTWKGEGEKELTPHKGGDMFAVRKFHEWISDGGYTFDGEYYYDKGNNYFKAAELLEKYRQEVEREVDHG